MNEIMKTKFTKADNCFSYLSLTDILFKSIRSYWKNDHFIRSFKWHSLIYFNWFAGIIVYFCFNCLILICQLKKAYCPRNWNSFYKIPYLKIFLTVSIFNRCWSKTLLEDVTLAHLTVYFRKVRIAPIYTGWFTKTNRV